MMKMRMILSLLVAWVFLSCSQTGIAGFVKNGKTEWLVYSDTAKMAINQHFNYQDSTVPDAFWMKSVIFNSMLFPYLAVMEMCEAGLTNQPDFQDYYRKEMKKLYWNMLYEKGRILAGKELMEAGFNVVRVSHILIDVPSIIKKKEIDQNASPALAEEYWMNAYIVATNMISALQSSPTQKQLFENYAKKYSQDAYTAKFSGDMGYIVEGQLFPEFDQAVMKLTSPGLITEPLRSVYGYHILYVTATRKKMTPNEIVKLTGANLSLLMPVFEKQLQSAQITELYTFDPKTGVISVDGYDFKPSILPDYALLLKIWGRPYSWKECRELIEVFNPSFNGGKDVSVFMQEMKSLKNFLYYAGLSLAKGEADTPEFKANFAVQKEKWLQAYCSDALKYDLRSAAMSKVTLPKMKEYFESMKPSFDKLNSVPAFESSSNAIFQALADMEYKGLFIKWQTNAVKKYGVVWNNVFFEDFSKELMKSQ